jgi:hypothetical protein
VFFEELVGMGRPGTFSGNASSYAPNYSVHSLQDTQFSQPFYMSEYMISL